MELKQVTFERAIETARGLNDQPIGDEPVYAPNIEYNRGMCELIGDMWGIPEYELSARAEDIADMLGIKIRTES